MTHTPDPTEPHRCPLCGQPNQCAMEIERQTGIKQPPCWCTAEKIPQALLTRIAAADVNRACVCAACIQAASAT
jgi:hypothetical protein